MAIVTDVSSQENAEPSTSQNPLFFWPDLELPVDLDKTGKCQD